jgi:hypothetical protein
MGAVVAGCKLQTVRVPARPARLYHNRRMYFHSQQQEPGFGRTDHLDAISCGDCADGIILWRIKN